MKQSIQLSDHFTYGRLLRFTLPSIGMMIFTSIYGVVDGFFVSNFAGKTAFAAINLIMPLLMIFSTVGFMFGTGGSALVAKTLGEGDKEKANRYFSLFVYVCAALGIVFTVIGMFIAPPVAEALGAEGQMLHDAVLYYSGSASLRRFAAVVPVLHDYRRKAHAGTVGHRLLRRDQHGDGCGAGHAAASRMEADRRSHCNSAESDCWRRDSVGVFFPEEQQHFAFGKDAL